MGVDNISLRGQLGKKATDVLYEAAIPTEMEKGWRLEISCFRDVEKRFNAFHGSWAVALLSPEGEPEQRRVLLTSAGIFKEFKTVVGLFSFLQKAGFRAPQFPIYDGETVVLTKDTWSMPQDD